jgi:DNA-binding response OmpR family regulator
MSSAIVTETVADAAEAVVRFGPFTLRPAQRVLMEGDTPVHLGSRAFDILLLLERAGTSLPRTRSSASTRRWLPAAPLGGVHGD